ncbi:MAG TPA: histidine ammonia-lyase [Myxococcota bacterium]|nr:histidine ammonia-lyase [Myxococcota bacterium]HOH77569.1 histidine ammonia-lyase [Myxococcota bacterium]
MNSSEVIIGAVPLTIEMVHEVARNGARVSLSADAVERIRRGRAVVEGRLGDGLAHYGINTGFGALAEVAISPNDLSALQFNLIRSHAAGVGDPLPTDVVRAAMCLRVAVLATGNAGIRLETTQTLADMLNAGIHPVVPSRGSVGASGDLAPLAHIALSMIGEGRAEYQGKVVPTIQALDAAGIKPVTLMPKEGLALVNGTQVLTAVGLLALMDAYHLVAAAELAGAMSLEGLMGTPDAFDHRVVAARPHPGQIESARILRALLDGSELRHAHVNCGRVQDPYSYRCMPQVHGAVRDNLDHIRRVIEIEINSATDNPLVFFDGDIVSGGNFHGEPVAIALDLLAIAVAELGSISDRRVEHLVNPKLSYGLPAFLAPDSGLCSGLMIAQVAAASLVSENKILAHPASVDSIPTSANREDHVSMGMTAALKAAAVVVNTRRVIAVEILAACAAIDLRHDRGRPAPAIAAALDTVRQVVEPLRTDRVISYDIEAIDRLLVPGGGLVETAWPVAGLGRW